MEPLKETAVIQALLKPPLFFGVPRWFVTMELVLVVSSWIGARLHWSSVLLTVVVFLVVHPFVAWKSRENPWAVSMFITYMRRPVLYSNRPMLRAKPLRAYRALP